MIGTKKFDVTFLKQIAIVLVVVIGLAYVPLMKYASDQVVEGVVAGILLSVVHALLGFVVIQFSLNKSYTVFMQIVLGGIAVRLFVMVGLLLLCVGLFKFHAISVIGSLFLMFVIFLTLEVLYIHKKIQN